MGHKEVKGEMLSKGKVNGGCGVEEIPKLKIDSRLKPIWGLWQNEFTLKWLKAEQKVDLPSKYLNRLTFGKIRYQS